MSQLEDRSTPLRGVFAAVVTPFTDTLDPNLDAFVAHCRWLLANGCTGLVPLATAGEANSMSVAQRLRLIEALAIAGLPMERMIIGGGSCALDDAVTLTRAIMTVRAGGVLLLPPFYYRDTGEDGLYRFYAETIERVGNPALRVFLHHRPQMSGAPITFDLITRLRAAFGPVIAGVQNGSGDWEITAALLREFPGLAIFSGTERFLLDTLRAGGAGCISATVNLTAPLAGPVYAQWLSDKADALQAALTAVRVLFDAFPTPAAQKEVLTRLTGDPSWRNLLPPLLPMAPAMRTELARQLETLPQIRTVLAAARAA
jgi:4-hydroxy-tetrahydrodipicolinate synthase